MAKNNFDEEYGGLVPRRVLRTKKNAQQQEFSMGRGPKRKNDDIRNQPVSGSPSVVKQVGPGPANVHPKNKQYTSSKVKNSHPRYVQRKTSSDPMDKC